MFKTLLLIATIALSACMSAQSQSAFTSPNSSETAKTTSAPSNQVYDPLLDLPPLPHSKVALIGGTVMSLDPVLNRMTIRPFGEKKQMHLGFDMRSQIFRDGQPASARDLKQGQRVYVDTMLNGTKIFAKTIQIRTSGADGNGHGQIMDYDSGSSTLTLRDELSAQPVHFRLSTSTVIRKGNQTRSPADLVPGSLVSLTFGNSQGDATVREISLLASPGSTFSFFGKITFVDLSRKLIAVNNRNDDKTYEIRLALIPASMLRNLHEGTEIGVSAVFDGNQYVARNVAFAAGQTTEH